MHRRDYLTATSGLVGTAMISSTSTAQTTEQRFQEQAQEQEQFELVNLEGPENKVEVMTPFTRSYTVANTGDDEGTVWVPYTVNAYGESTTEYDGVPIPAGEEVTVERNHAFAPYLGQIEIRLHRFNEAYEFEAVPATRAFGDDWRSPKHVTITVDGVELTDTYEYDGVGGRTEEAAGSGSQWAFVQLRAENRARENVRLPDDFQFMVVTDEGQFEPNYILREGGQYESATVTPGDSRSGWIAFEIPDGLSVDDIAVRYHEEGIEGVWEANWRATDNSQ